jgi:hypothetical protein
LKAAQRADPQFKKELKKAAMDVAKILVADTQKTASSVKHEGTGRSAMFVEAAKGLRASPDRFPTIKLAGSSGFVSKSAPNRKRKTKVTRSDVFFGAEFGGQARKSTNQFNRYVQSPTGRGGRGYFFFPTVRRDAGKIAEQYLDAIDVVLRKLSEE